MPLYTYIDQQTGEATVRMVPIAERDNQPGLRRVFEPCVPLPPPGGGPRLTLQAQQVLAGYQRLEERGRLRHKTRSEVSRIKAAWSGETEAKAAAEAKAQPAQAGAN